MDVLCELYPVEMTAILASKRIFAAAATGGARTAELPNITRHLLADSDVPTFSDYNTSLRVRRGGYQFLEFIIIM